MEFYDYMELRQLYYDDIKSAEILENSSNVVLNLCVLMFCVRYPFKGYGVCSYLTSEIQNKKGVTAFYTRKIYYNKDCSVTYYCTTDTSSRPVVISKEYYIVKFHGECYLLTWDSSWRSCSDWVKVYIKMKMALCKGF